MTTIVDTEIAEINEEELAFNKDDFAYAISWQKYLKGEKLQEFDFVEKDNYTRYLLLSLEMVDFALIVLDGLKGSGKTMFLTWLGHELKRLFDKPSTLNYRPKDAYGDFDYLTEQVFLDEWVKLTELADREDCNELVNDIARLTEYSSFYNRFIGIDEARKWASKYKNNSRLLGYIGELIDVSRHNHNVIAFSMPNAFDMLNKDTVLENRTHVISCGFNTTYYGHASYCIKHRNSGRTQWLHLPAKKLSHLWESWSLIAMSRPITKKQLEEAQARARGDYKDIEGAVHGYKKTRQTT